MSVGSRIKELREAKNITRNELASMLGITVGAISNYENEVSFPKEPILFKIIEILDCDANYLFQDSIKMSPIRNNVSITEYNLIEKYRTLDEYGKETVSYILERESIRVENQFKRINKYAKLITQMHNSKQPLAHIDIKTPTPNHSIDLLNKHID